MPPKQSQYVEIYDDLVENHRTLKLVLQRLDELYGAPQGNQAAVVENPFGGVEQQDHRWESSFRVDIPEFDGSRKAEESIDWFPPAEETMKFEEVLVGPPIFDKYSDEDLEPEGDGICIDGPPLFDEYFEEEIGPKEYVTSDIVDFVPEVLIFYSTSGKYDIFKDEPIHEHDHLTFIVGDTQMSCYYPDRFSIVHIIRFVADNKIEMSTILNWNKGSSLLETLDMTLRLKRPQTSPFVHLIRMLQD